MEIADKSPQNADPCWPAEEFLDISPAQTTPDPQLALTKRSNHHDEEDVIRWDTTAYLSTDNRRDAFRSFSGDLSSQIKKGDHFLYEGLDIAPNSNHNPSLAFIAPSVSPSPLFEFCAPAFEEFSNDFHHRLLMNHFCNTLSHLIVLREDDGNPFQQLVLPLAYSSPAVKGAIYALASAHLEGKGIKKLENDEQSIQFHNEAIRSLAKLIAKGENANKNELLATIILLVYYEVVSLMPLLSLLRCSGADFGVARTEKAIKSCRGPFEGSHGNNAE